MYFLNKKFKGKNIKMSLYVQFSNTLKLFFQIWILTHPFNQIVLTFSTKKRKYTKIGEGKGRKITPANRVTEKR